MAVFSKDTRHYVCLKCHQAFRKGNFCHYCSQIFVSDEHDDGMQWVGCDHCSSWVHTECEARSEIHDIKELMKFPQFSLYCARCRCKRDLRPKYNQHMRGMRELARPSKKSKPSSSGSSTKSAPKRPSQGYSAEKRKDKNGTPQKAASSGAAPGSGCSTVHSSPAVGPNKNGVGSKPLAKLTV